MNVSRSGPKGACKGPSCVRSTHRTHRRLAGFAALGSEAPETPPRQGRPKRTRQEWQTSPSDSGARKARTEPTPPRRRPALAWLQSASTEMLCREPAERLCWVDGPSRREESRYRCGTKSPGGAVGGKGCPLLLRALAVGAHRVHHAQHRVPIQPRDIVSRIEGSRRTTDGARPYDQTNVATISGE